MNNVGSGIRGGCRVETESLKGNWIFRGIGSGRGLSNDPHVLRNVGATRATYHVFNFITPQAMERAAANAAKMQPPAKAKP